MMALARAARRSELGPFGIRVNTINASITPSFAVPAAAPEGGLVLVRLLHQRQEDTAVDQALFGGSTLRALRTAHLHDTKTVPDSRTFTKLTVLWIE